MINEWNINSKLKGKTGTGILFYSDSNNMQHSGVLGNRMGSRTVLCQDRCHGCLLTHSGHFTLSNNSLAANMFSRVPCFVIIVFIMQFIILYKISILAILYIHEILLILRFKYKYNILIYYYYT